MKKETMRVGGFRIEAEIDGDGFLRLFAGSAIKGRRVIGINHPEGPVTTDTGEQIVLTDNDAIIAYELNETRSQDCRHDPEKLRKSGQDQTFRRWWGLTNKDTPEATAESVESIRRREGRDPKTGALLAAVAVS